jgi:hypothetical protein
MANNERTLDLSQRFELSPARISHALGQEVDRPGVGLYLLAAVDDNVVERRRQLIDGLAVVELPEVGDLVTTRTRSAPTRTRRGRGAVVGRRPRQRRPPPRRRV